MSDTTRTKKCQKKIQSEDKLASLPLPVSKVALAGISISWRYRQNLPLRRRVQQAVFLRLLYDVVHHLGVSGHTSNHNTAMTAGVPLARDRRVCLLGKAA